MRAIFLSLLAGLCCGCFILDELDRGDELMEQVSDRGGAKKKAAAARAAKLTAEPASASESPDVDGMVDTAKKWWSKATAPARSEPDPNDGVMRCRVGGEVQYMRASDCRIRGGKAA